MFSPRTGGSLACQTGHCTGEAATFKARARSSGRAPLEPGTLRLLAYDVKAKQ